MGNFCSAGRARALLVVVALVSSALSGATGRAQAARPSDLPSPEQFFGYQMGADRKLANWDKLLEYYQTLAKSAKNMQLVELGKSSEGRPYIALFITSPANLAKLDRLKQLNARLADPRGLSEAEAQKLVAEARAVVIQSFALHSSEVAAAQTAAEFVYDSMTRTDEEAQRMLDNVDQHRRALDQSRRHADDCRLVHEVRRHAERGRADCPGSIRNMRDTTTTATASP